MCGSVCRFVDLGAKAHSCRPYCRDQVHTLFNKFRSSAIVNDPLVEFESLVLAALLKETSKVDLDEWWPTARTPRFIVCVALPTLRHAIRIHAG